MGRFTASIDDEVQKQLDDYAKAKGYNRSEALELILRKHFDEDSEPAPSPAPEREAPVQNPSDNFTNHEASIDLIQKEAALKEQYLSELYLSLERMRAHMETHFDLLFEDYLPSPLDQLPVPPWMEDQGPS